MATILITGCSRGIGLELIKQLLDAPNNEISKVFAVTRNRNSAGLQQLLDGSPSRLSNVIIENLSDPSQAQTAAKEVEVALQGKGLDILVNNAGMSIENPDGVSTMSSKDLLDVFTANVVSAQTMTAAFVPLLRQGSRKRVINVSSHLGSVAHYPRFAMAPSYSYKISKAAMNMLTVQYAWEFEKEGFTFVTLSPGWLKTDMGSQYADLEIETGVRAVKDVVLRSDKADNGKFLTIRVAGWEQHDGPNQYDGGELPW